VAKWNRTVELDNLGVHPTSGRPPQFRGSELDWRMLWVASTTSAEDGQRFGLAVAAMQEPRLVHITLTRAHALSAINRGIPGFATRWVVRDYCLDGPLRWWYRLPVFVVMDHRGATAIENAGPGQLVATDLESRNPVRFRGWSLTWALAPSVGPALAVSAAQQAALFGSGLSRGLFAPPSFPRCPNLTDDRLLARANKERDWQKEVTQLIRKQRRTRVAGVCPYEIADYAQRPV
jgi:hypothetical protein